MPTDEQHITQAQHNASVLTFLTQQEKQEELSDWFTTIAFYSALHFVEAIFFRRKPKIVCENGMPWPVQHSTDAKVIFNKIIEQESIKKSQSSKDPTHLSKLRKAIGSDHHARIKLLRESPISFQKIYTPFVNLYETSRKARYYCHNPKTYSYIDADDWFTAVRNEFMACFGIKKVEDITNPAIWCPNTEPPN
jgi:hypothetical protein